MNEHKTLQLANGECGKCSRLIERNGELYCLAIGMKMPKTGTEITKCNLKR